MSAYSNALARGRKKGAGAAPRPEILAMFCESNLQTLVGAVSPELVWRGAMARGLSFLEFGRLCGKDVRAVDELQWFEVVVIERWHRDRKKVTLWFDRLPDKTFGPYDLPNAVTQLFVGALLPMRDARDAVLEALDEGVSARPVQK